MHYIVIIGLLIIFFAMEHASAAVYIPEGEYTAYFNSGGFYTIVGKVISTENKPVKPTIHVEVQYNNTIIKKSIEWVPILNVPSLSREMPFKIILPEVKSDAIIRNMSVTFEYVDRKPLHVIALYDNSLIMYNDHVTGKVINFGNETVYNIRVYAGAHAMDGSWLDTSISQEIIDELKPGESKPFTLYIDPIFKGKVGYYSCFAPSDPFVMNLTTTRYDEKFEIYAVSVMWFYGQKFNEDTNTLHFNSTSNSLPLPIIVTFRVPISSMDEKFQVYFDGEIKDVLQSMDEDGMSWHISFEYPPISSIKDIRLIGFDEPRYNYIKHDTDKSIRVVAQIPKEIIPMQQSTIRFAFYNSTTDTLLNDIRYNVKFIKDENVILDLDRIAIKGVDTFNHAFENEGMMNMKINIIDEDVSVDTNIVVIPEFPIGILIIAASMLIMLVIKFSNNKSS